MTRLVFMGTPAFAVPTLEALIDSGYLVGVVTQPDRPAGRGKNMKPPPVKTTAVAAGLPVYQPRSLRKPEAIEPIAAWQPDLIVVAAFGQILRPHLLTLPPLGCVNVHASLLPRWRGASPIQHAILAGDDETGVTLMQMDEGLDTGDMLVKEALVIRPDETAASLHDRLAELGGTMMRRYLADLVAQRLTPMPQDDAFSTYAPLISKEDGRLDWSHTAVALERRVRALTPWPGAFTMWNGALLKIHTAEAWSTQRPNTAVGTVWSTSDAVLVQTGAGALALGNIQLAGKKVISSVDFINGRPDFVGAVLGKDA
jgi:methionyl-tRNA formyltransferase